MLMLVFKLQTSNFYSSFKNAGTLTARPAGGSEASNPIVSTVKVTGKKSQIRMEIG